MWQMNVPEVCRVLGMLMPGQRFQVVQVGGNATFPTCQLVPVVKNRISTALGANKPLIVFLPTQPACV